MRIRWYGQSAFLLSGEHTVMIDPFGAIDERVASRGLVFDYPPIEGVHADLVLITHEHFDHNAAETIAGSPPVIRATAGTLDSPIGPVIAVASEHDAAAGTERGPNTIFRFTLDGLGVCHLGDFGQAELRPQQRHALGEPDILLLPVGGGPTIGAEAAAAVVRALRPRLVVPMHYRTEAINFLDPPNTFLDALDARVERLPTSDLDTNDLLGSRDQPTVALPAPPLRE